MKGYEQEMTAAKTRQHPNPSLPVPLSSEKPRVRPGGLDPEETKFFVAKLMDLLNLARR